MRLARHRSVLLLAVCIAVAALSACSSAPEETEITSETRNRAAEYTEFGNRYLDRAQYDQALKFYNLALEDNIAIDNQEGIVLSRNAIGEAFLLTAQYDKAAASFAAAMELSLELGRRDLELRTLNNEGKLALNLGRSDAALVSFQKARDIIDSEKDSPTDIVADIYHSTGALYKILEEYDQAESYLLLSLDLNRDLNRLEEEASNYYVLASVYSKQEFFDRAETNLERALKIDKQIENKLGIADDYYALGLVAEKRGDFEAAYNHFRTAVDKYIILNKLRPTIDSYYRLRELALLLGKDAEAASYGETISVLEESRR